MAQPTSRLGELLVGKHLLNVSDLNAALEYQQQYPDGTPVGELLVALGRLTPDVLSAALAEHYGLEAYSPATDAQADAVRLIPKAFAEEQLVLAIRIEGSTLAIATTRPTHAQLLEYVRDKTGKDVRPLVGAAATIREGIATAYETIESLQRHVDAFESADEVGARGDMAASHIFALTEDAPVVRIVNIVLSEGLRERASDIHIEPQNDCVRVRYRIDGTLHDVKELPKEIGPALVSRIKVMGEMNVVEHNKPQDGQMALGIDGRDVDVRVSTSGTIWGEKVVLRLLDRSRSIIGLHELGFPDDVADRYVPLVQIPFGLVVVAGPTGAGKTTTLYASINELDRHGRNITTIEDPVEYIFPRISQMQIHPEAGITFAAGLRALLRQDPDVILVGEVRDRETAEIATQAALTGHAVFCSVHATDSIGAMYRFIDMGVETYLLGPALEAIVSQRLVKRVCSHCAVDYEPPATELAVYEKVTGGTNGTFRAGVGCDWCRGTGYYDRVGVYELLRLDGHIKELIVRKAPKPEIRESAIAGGMQTLQEAAMEKVRNGETTVTEVLRTVYAG